jgi:hypothetical protein
MSTEDENFNEFDPVLDAEIPTRIHFIDELIAHFNDLICDYQKKIAEEIATKNKLIVRANKFNITQDKYFKIVKVPIYDRQRVDVKRLKELITPEDYRKILSKIESELNDKYTEGVKKSEEFISQSDVKAVVKDKNILMQVIVTPPDPIRYDISVVKQ